MQLHEDPSLSAPSLSLDAHPPPSQLDLIELTARLVECLYESEGVVDDSCRELMEAYAERHGDRAERIALLRALELRLEAEAEFIQREVDRLAARRDALKRLAGSAKARALQHMEDHAFLTGETVLALPGHQRCRLVDNPERVVGPERPEDWPAEYQRVEVRADRVAAKAALRRGGRIEGLRLERNGSHLRWG